MKKIVTIMKLANKVAARKAHKQILKIERVHKRFQTGDNSH